MHGGTDQYTMPVDIIDSSFTVCFESNVTVQSVPTRVDCPNQDFSATGMKIPPLEWIRYCELYINTINPT